MDISLMRGQEAPTEGGCGFEEGRQVMRRIAGVAWGLACLSDCTRRHACKKHVQVSIFASGSESEGWQAEVPVAGINPWTKNRKKTPQERVSHVVGKRKIPIAEASRACEWRAAAASEPWVGRIDAIFSIAASR